VVKLYAFGKRPDVAFLRQGRRVPGRLRRVWGKEQLLVGMLLSGCWYTYK
jgi:hypothetical protein